MEDIKNNIYETFSNIATAIGYSGVHGKIIAALLTADKPISIQEIADDIKASLATVSLSIDLLEIIGLVKRIKKTGDRKLYVEMDGDMIEGLKTAMLFKWQKNIQDALDDLENYEKNTKDEKITKMIKDLEKEVKRLEIYVDKLSEVDIPK